MAADAAVTFRLQRDVDPTRDHVRGGGGEEDRVTVVLYGDFLCPYCRRLIPVLARLREALGNRLVYVFRHFPNERAHPGAERVLLDFARELGLDTDRFKADTLGDEARERIEEDLEEGRSHGVTGTPTLFVDGIRYDGAWDFYSMLEALEGPVAARVKRAGRVFASLPASGGVVLLLAAAAAIAVANSPLGDRYASIQNAFHLTHLDERAECPRRDSKTWSRVQKTKRRRDLTAHPLEMIQNPVPALSVPFRGVPSKRAALRQPDGNGEVEKVTGFPLYRMLPRTGAVHQHVEDPGYVSR